MIEIYMKNVTSKIDNLNDCLKKIIVNELSYTESGFGKKPKLISLFNSTMSTTYTGLIPHVIRVLNKFNIEYHINDLRIIPERNGDFKIQNGFELRDYQKKIVDNVSSRDIIQAATGAGKTFIMASLIVKHNVKPVIVIAPSISLALQIKNEFEKFLGIPIGICGGGKNIIEDITVSTPVSAPKDFLKECKMIMWDEYHTGAAESIWNTGIVSNNAYYRYGMSATPWRDDGKDLLLESIANVRKPHLTITASKLIKTGKLTPCSIKFIQINEVFEWPGSYGELYKQSIICNEHRNNIIINKAIEMYKQNKTILILIKSIEHGELLLKGINQNNNFMGEDNVKFLSGGNSPDERQTIIDEVKDGKVKILIASTIADQGLDLPILDCLILAGGGRSSTRAFQRIGRVLRLYKNKTEAIVFDFKDMTPTLYNHYLYRKALYETEPLWTIIE